MSSFHYLGLFNLVTLLLWVGYLIGFVFKKYPNESMSLKIFLICVVSLVLELGTFLLSSVVWLIVQSFK